MCLAVEKAWKAGIVVVVAAGNLGRDNSLGTQGYATITAPANDPYVITVGATRQVGRTKREDDMIASSSSKGPTLRDKIVKPDLVAPGNLFYARMQPAHYLVTSYQANYQANYVGLSMNGGAEPIGNTVILSGTSMAAPMAAAAAARVLEKDCKRQQAAGRTPVYMTPDQVKARLMRAAFKGMPPTARIYDARTGQTFNLQHDVFTIGAGHLDLKAALSGTTVFSSTRRALSPRAVFANGKATISNNWPSYASLYGTDVIWGEKVNFAVNVSWGDNVIWGGADPYSEALSVAGDRPW